MNLSTYMFVNVLFREMTMFDRVFRKSFCLLISSAMLLLSTGLHAQQSALPTVDSVTLVNADTGEAIADYDNNSSISNITVLSENADRISLRFNTSNTSSVRISGVSDSPRIENQQPFSLLGDDGSVYEPWSPNVGDHIVVVEPFSAARASGVPGESVIVNLSVVEQIEEPEPTPTPSPNPRPVLSDTGRIMPSINYLLLNDEQNELDETQQVVVIVGASIVQQAFGQDLSQTDERIMNKLRDNGVDNIDFYSYGFSGSRISHILPVIDTVLATYPDAKVIVHIGGNNVTTDRPYFERTQDKVDDFTSSIEALIAKFSGIEDQLILVPLTYRAYADVNFDDFMFLDGSTGSEPFNIYEYLPRIPEDQKNVDGNHILDLFNFTRNNRFTLGGDGIHFNKFGNEYIRQFIADRLGYLINGGERPSVVVPGGPPEPFDPDCCG